MLKINTFSENELVKVDFLLNLLPNFCSEVSEIAREDYLVRQGNAYASVAGIYRSEPRSITLYNSAFWGTVELGETEIPVLDLTLFTLIGYSLIDRPEISKGWPAFMYPRFNKGRGGNERVNIFDRKLIKEELVFTPHFLSFNPEMVSLEKSFALAYSCYLIFPNALLNAYPEVYKFLKEKVFQRKEYGKKETDPTHTVYRLHI